MQRRDPLWISSSECTETSTRQQQRYCAGLDRLTGELGAAGGAENLRQREQDLRSALLEQAPAEGGAHPDLKFFVDTFGVPVEAVVFWRTIILTVAIELSEPMAALFATLLFRGHLPSKTDTGTCSLLGRLLAMVAALAARWRWWPLASRAPALAHQPHPIGQAVAQGGSTRKRKPSAPEKTNRHMRSRSSAGVANGGSSAQKKQALDQAAAVAAFVAVLPKDGAGRVAGSDIYAAYDRCRDRRGWPYLAPNTFGRLLKPAIEAVGGRKLKSNGQLYIGVCLPPIWP